MNTQEAKLASVKKSSHAAKIAAKILTGIITAGGLVCIAAFFIVLAVQDKIDAYGAAYPDSFNITNPQLNGLISLRIDLAAMLESGNYAMAIMIVVAFAAVMCLLVSFIMRLLLKALTKLDESDTPFDSSVLSYMRKAFIGLTLLMLLINDLGSAIIVGLSLWCVYCIMDYGCTLQEEVDETV